MLSLYPGLYFTTYFSCLPLTISVENVAFLLDVLHAEWLLWFGSACDVVSLMADTEDFRELTDTTATISQRNVCKKENNDNGNINNNLSLLSQWVVIYPIPWAPATFLVELPPSNFDIAVLRSH
jgi:hypothetical protein